MIMSDKSIALWTLHAAAVLLDCFNISLHSPHRNDVIMAAIASQITSLAIVISTFYSEADQRKHQSSASLAFVPGIHRGPVTRKMFPFHNVIMLMANKLHVVKAVQGIVSGIWKTVAIPAGHSSQQWIADYRETIATYRRTSNISCTLVGNKIVDYSDVVGASPVRAAPTLSSFST